MNSQIGCLSGCKFALVTFVGFSSTMYLHVIVQICCEIYQKIALITFIGLFSTVCPQANPIAKYHCHMYLLTSTRADYSLNEFPPQKNLLKPCTLCAYQGPANSKGKLHSFLQLIILQHGRRFPAHHRSKST